METMHTKVMAIESKEWQYVQIKVFLLVLFLALLAMPKITLGECGDAPSPGIPSAYSVKAGQVYGSTQLHEDATWARYAHRGQAFADCPKLAPLPETAYTPLPVKKKSAVKRKSSRGVASKQAQAKSSATATKSAANPCPPILMPVPALPICPDPKLGKAQ